MRRWYEYEENAYLMAKACQTEDECGRLNRAYIDMQKAIEKDGIKNKYGLVSVAESILSARTYYTISQLDNFKEETIVIDFGCGEALQQVFFRDYRAYIGIDCHDTFFQICDNAKLIKSEIVEWLNNFEPKKGQRYLAISVLCGSVFKEVGDAIKAKFDEVVLI